MEKVFPELSDNQLKEILNAKLGMRASMSKKFKPILDRSHFSSLIIPIYSLTTDGQPKSVLFHCRISDAEKLGARKSMRYNHYITEHSIKFDRTSQAGNYERGQSFKTFPSNSKIKSIARKNYTFGVEIETCKGTVPIALFNDNNIRVECTRDGSITGGEYVTGILQHDWGFYDLYKLTNILSNYTRADNTCGVHVHIGGLIFNKSFTNLAYILGVKIQDELFEYLHSSRSNNPMCGKLNKSMASLGTSMFKEFPVKHR